MSFEIKITGHSPDDHAQDVKDFAVSAARVLREKLGPGATVTLGGYSTDSKLDLRFGDGDVADAIARKEAAAAGLTAEGAGDPTTLAEGEEWDATAGALAHAEATGVDIAAVEGTGKGGTVTKSDVAKAADKTADK